MMLVSSFPYNFISNQDNTIYSEGTTPSTNKLQNGSFEDGPFFSGSYSQPSQADVPHWNTTAYEGKIELLKSNNNVYISGVTLTPTEGTYAAELNADEESTLYQIVSTTPSSIYEWGLDHGSRNGTDTMALVIGPAQSVNPSKPSKDGRDQFMQMTDWLAGKGITSVKTSGSGHSDVITCYSKKFGTEGTFLDNADNNAFSLTPTTQHTEEWKIWIIYDSKVTTGTNPWGKYGSNDPVNASTNGTVDLDKYNLYNVPVGQTSTIFAFVSVGFHDGGGKTFGNFLDNINFKIYHRLTGSTSTNGNGLVVKSSDNSSHSIYVTDELLTYVDDNENLTLTAIIKKEDFDEGCEFAGMYYTTIGSNGNEVITFINTGSDNVVDSSYTGSTDGKWVRTINTNGDVEYKYALNGIKASTDIHFVFIKSPTITYDSNGGKPYVATRTYNADEPENVYSFKPSTGAENITFIEPYTSKAAEGLYNDWKFTGWKLTGDILSITSSGITIVNADRLNSYILPAEHTVVCDYSFNGVLNNKSHQYFKIYKSKPAFTKNEVITDGTLKGVNWNTDNSDLAYANVNTGLTMVAQWRWRQTFTPQYLSEGSYVNSITGGTVRVTSVGSDNENYNSNFTSEGAVAYFAEANEQITAEATANTNYKFVGWFDEKGNLISTNKTYTYTVNAQDTKKYYARFVLSTSTDTYTTYKVEHYIVDGSTTSLYTSVDKVGFMGTKVTAEPIAISGYSYNSSHSENIIEKVIPTTGTLTLKLYYGKTYTNTLKYDFNGGHSSSIANQTVSVTYPNTKSKFTVTTTKPLKTGYSFDGWYTEQEGGTKVVDSTYEVGINDFAGNQEATLYAHWIPNTYTNTVVYNLNGGILNIENSINTTNNVTYPNTASDHAVTDEVPSKTGYSFIGWYTAIDGGDKKEASNTYTFGQNNYQGNQITKLYAHWAPINYINTLKYNLNGGTSTATINDQSKTVTFPNTESTFALTDIVPTKTGYTFDGWYDASDVKHSTSYTVGQSNYAGNQEATLYAKWVCDQYTITYNLDGGTVNTENPTSYNISSDNIVLNNPTRQGYDFAGWTGSNGTTPEITAGVPSGSTGDKVFKANWTLRNDTTYKVQHWQQTLTGGDEENNVNYEIVTADTENLTGTTGASVTPAVKTYEGFASPTKRTVSIEPDGSTVVNYYYRRNSYTVTLITGSNINSVSGGGTYKYGQAVNVSASAESGYYFAGWTGDFSSSEFVMPAHDVTMTANATTGQTAKYTVYHYEIDANDNPTTIELAKDVLYGDVGSQVTAVPKDIPGYTFADSYQPNIKTGNVEASGSLVLKLYYHTDTLTYYANGGHLANDSSIDQITDTGHIGQQLTVRNSGTFVKDGYTFIGWNTMPDVTGVTYNPGSSYALTSNEDKLYAVWVRNISLIYDANAPAGTTVQGNTDPDYSYVGSTVTVKNNGFVIDGYYFIKWNTKSDGTGVDYINPNDYCLSDYTSENVNSNVLYAQWGRLNTYKVKHTLLKSNEEVFTTYETDYYGRNGQIVNATSNNYEGYYLEGLSTMSGTVDDQNSLVLEFKYKPKNNIPYKVFHYLVDRNGNISLEEQIISTGYTNDVVQAVSKTISNYAFDDSYSGTILSDSIRADGTTELKLYYIENKYSLTFKANYGTEADQVRYDYGDQSVSVLPALTRSGYAFAGWNTMMDGGGTTYMPGDNYALQYTDGVLYAQWVPVIVPVSTTLIYKPNGGNGTDQVYNGYVDDNVSVIDNPFDRNGYTFTGWNTRADGSGTAYGAGDNYTLIDGDNVLYAQWKKNRPNHSTYTGEIPLTADESNIAVWIGICITSFIAMIGMILIKRQSKGH